MSSFCVNLCTEYMSSTHALSCSHKFLNVLDIEFVSTSFNIKTHILQNNIRNNRNILFCKYFNPNTTKSTKHNKLWPVGHER
jgi:hypothetical protein